MIETYYKRRKDGRYFKMGKYTLGVGFIDQPPGERMKYFNSTPLGPQKMRRWLDRMNKYITGEKTPSNGRSWAGRVTCAILYKRIGDAYNYTQVPVKMYKDYDGYGHFEWRNWEEKPQMTQG